MLGSHLTRHAAGVPDFYASVGVYVSEKNRPTWSLEKEQARGHDRAKGVKFAHFLYPCPAGTRMMFYRCPCNTPAVFGRVPADSSRAYGVRTGSLYCDCRLPEEKWLQSSGRGPFSALIFSICLLHTLRDKERRKCCVMIHS